MLEKVLQVLNLYLISERQYTFNGSGCLLQISKERPFCPMFLKLEHASEAQAGLVIADCLAPPQVSDSIDAVGLSVHF